MERKELFSETNMIEKKKAANPIEGITSGPSLVFIWYSGYPCRHHGLNVVHLLAGILHLKLQNHL